MDALEFLKADHNRVKKIFENFKNLPELERKTAMQTLIQELRTHSYIEEVVFYPTFEKYDEMKEILDEFYEDHAEVEDLLTALQKSRDDLSFRLLAERMSRHIEREENELFPMILKVMKRSEREALGRLLQAQKSEQMRAA
jgi:hemerythrin superfamily protein